MKKRIVAALVILTSSAVADGGIYSENRMDVDNILVRRVRDTSEHVVCYIASTHNRVYGGEVIPTAISCLPEVTRR